MVMWSNRLGCAKSWLGSRSSATPLAKVARTRARWGTLQFRRCDLQHGLGRVKPEQACRRVAVADQGKVAPGAAADVENGLARSGVELRDQPVAAEQVVFAGEVVDVLLRPVHPVHAPADVLGGGPRARRPQEGGPLGGETPKKRRGAPGA